MASPGRCRRLPRQRAPHRQRPLWSRLGRGVHRPGTPDLRAV